MAATKTASTPDEAAAPNLSDEHSITVGFKVLRALDRSDSTSADVADVLEQDPSLGRQVLKMARSPLCGIRNPDLTPARAVVLLGFVTVRKLVVMSLCRDLGSMKNRRGGFHWRHALWVGIAAEEITRRVDESLASDALMAGMTSFMSEEFAAQGPARPDGTEGVDALRMQKFIRAAGAVAELIIDAQPGLPATMAIDEALEGAGLMPLHDGRLAVDIRRGFEIYASLIG